jgi:hypothetical protein
MTIHPSIGLEEIRFGMRKREILKKWGAPSREIEEENGCLTLCYFSKGVGLRLEDFDEARLGWIMVSNPQARIFDQPAIGISASALAEYLRGKLGEIPEIDDYGTWSSQTFRNAWIEVQETLGWVTAINFGVIFSTTDEPLWPDSQSSP